MAFTVVTKKRFENKVKKLLEYLVMDWQDKVAVDFLLKLNHTIDVVSNNPGVGLKIKDLNNTRSTLITKHNRLYYRIEKDTILILNMIDTRLSPNKNPFKKPA